VKKKRQKTLVSGAPAPNCATRRYDRLARKRSKAAWNLGNGAGFARNLFSLYYSTVVKHIENLFSGC
jgi:hypothetical protein